MRSWVPIAVAATTAAAACTSAPPPMAAVASVRELGALPFLPVIRGRDGGYSAHFGGHTAFVFGDTILNTAGVDGQSWRSSTFSLTDDADPGDGLSGFTEPLDANGAPGELLPFSPDEQAYNEAHRGTACTVDCGARWALWPGPLVVNPATGAALLFYGKVDARPGAYNFQGVGQSIATWAAPDAPVVRPALAPGAAEPTLLFPPGDPALGSGAVLDGDALYAYACECSGLTCPCKIARAPFADALTRAAWTFYDGSAWVSDANLATPIFNGTSMITVFRNPHLGAWAAVYSTPVANTIELRTAAAPEGPWSSALTITDTPAPGDPNAWNYAALAHPEFGDGARLYVTYYRPGANFDGEMDLLEVNLK